MSSNGKGGHVIIKKKYVFNYHHIIKQHESKIMKNHEDKIIYHESKIMKNHEDKIIYHDIDSAFVKVMKLCDKCD